MNDFFIQCKASFKMEMRKFFKDKSGLFLCIFIPVLLGTALGLLFSDGMKQDNRYEICIFCHNDEKSELESIIHDKNVKITTETYHSEVVKNGYNRVAIVVKNDIEVCYNSMKLSNPDVVYLAQHYAEQIAMKKGTIPVSEAHMPNLVDVHTDSDRFSGMVFLAVVMLFEAVTAAIALYLTEFAKDAIIGAKEKGSFDLIRLSSADIRAVIIGKELFLLALATISGIISVCSLSVLLKYFFGISLANSGWIPIIWITIAYLQSLFLIVLLAFLGSALAGDLRVGDSLIGGLPLAIPSLTLLCAYVDFPGERLLPAFCIWEWGKMCFGKKLSLLSLLLSNGIFIVAGVVILWGTMRALERNRE